MGSRGEQTTTNHEANRTWFSGLDTFRDWCVGRICLNKFESLGKILSGLKAFFILRLKINPSGCWRRCSQDAFSCTVAKLVQSPGPLPPQDEPANAYEELWPLCSSSTFFRSSAGAGHLSFSVGWLPRFRCHL